MIVFHDAVNVIGARRDAPHAEYLCPRCKVLPLGANVSEDAARIDECWCGFCGTIWQPRDAD